MNGGLNLSTSSSDLFGKDDSDFLEALRQVRTPPLPENQQNPTRANEATKTQDVSSSTALRNDSKSQSFSDLFGTDDPEFLETLAKMSLPGPSSDHWLHATATHPDVKPEDSVKSPLQSNSVNHSLLKRPRSPENEYMENHDIYGPSKFHGWGEYMHRKRAKLSVQNNEILENEEKRSDLFKGLALHVNGRTNPSVQELRKFIIQHGGLFHPYLDRKRMVTHIIASNLTPAKVLEFKNMKVVRPEWLLESINSGILLPWQNFALGTSSQAGSSQTSTKSNRPTIDKRPDTPSALNFSMNETKEEGHLPDSLPLPPNVDRPLHGTDPATVEEASRIPSYAFHTSNPFASRKMDDPKWRAENTAIAPGFIEGYYKNSRLHHLSTWKVELQELVAKAAETIENGEDQEGQQSVDAIISGGTSMSGITFQKPPSTRKGKNVAVEQQTIMHCDFDSFFVAAGLIDRPHLKGKPVVVCHSQTGQGGVASTSEIASSSYEARKFGIKGGMSLGQARRLCPEVQTVPYEFERYKRLSLQFYIILMSYADDIEAVSVDEALIDVSSTVDQARRTSIVNSNQSQPDFAKELAETIRKRVKDTTGCEISIGISHNVLLARVATRLAKPAGSYHILPENSLETLVPLDVEDIRGFGWSSRSKLKAKFDTTILGELSKQSKSALSSVLGKKNGEKLWNAIRGIDDTKLESDRVRKSVSCEINYGIRFTKQEEAETFVRNVAKEVSERLRKINKYGRSITLKIMVRDPNAPVEAPKFLGHGICETTNKSSILEGPGGKATADEIIIGDHAVRLLKAMNLDPKELRGVGIHVQKLEESTAAGQTLLQFKRTETPTVMPSRLSMTKSPSPQAQAAVVSPTKTGLEGDKPAHPFWLPSFSQLDTTVVAALPDDIRREIEQEYSKQDYSTRPVAGSSRHQNVLLESPSSSPSPTKPVQRYLSKSPRGSPGKQKHDVSRIIKQLAPKSRPSALSVKAMHPLFAKRLPLPDGSTINQGLNVNTQELKLFEVDPDVFKQLPMQIQREQLTSLRAVNVGTGIALRASMSAEAKQARLLNKWRNRNSRRLPRLIVRGRRQEVVAKHVEIPVLKKRGKDKATTAGEDLKVGEEDDVQAVLSQWVENFEEDGPREKDVNYFGKFLVKCVESDVGSEKAVLALKWWKFLLQSRWPGDDRKQSDQPQDGEILNLSVGSLWWKAFWDVKGRMDVVVKKRFGGQLSLK